uniref:VWFC domain-containing protein n=1 Tax=Cuerna arida TaxID=1464854 RepID=A0A1B6FLZ3_9HEMI
MIKCPVNNNGCRTIQRPNHCCPDYNCECDYNGQLYNDGERIDLPEEPCQVCYCKGGDVMCTSITCYQRDDCEPIHVPGQCCPKYENCPLRDQASSNGDDKSVRTRSPNHSPKREMQPWLLTKSVLQTSSLPVLKTSEDLTTEDSIVIVSDWLSERRSTTDDSSYQTLGPVVVTDSQNPTHKRHTISTINPDGSIVRQSETITPLDEVIFTRVDMPRGKPEHSHESATLPPFTNLIAITLTPFNNSGSEPSEETATVIDVLSSSSNTTPSFADGSSNFTIPSLKINSHVKIDEGKETSGSTEASTYTSTEASLNLKSAGMNDNSRIKIDGSQHEYNESHGETYTTSDYFTRPKDYNDSLSEVGLRKDPIVTSDTETDKSNIELDADTKFDDNAKQNIAEPAEEITLDHLFGFDKVYEEEVSLDTTSLETSTLGNTKQHLDNIQSTNYLNVGSEDTTGILEASTIRDDVTEDSSNEASEIISAKLYQDESDDSSIISFEGKNYNSKHINTISPTEVESTTPYITEDHMSELNLKSSEFVEGSHLVEDAKNFEDTTDFEVTNHEATESPLNDDNLKGKIVQINISNNTLKDNSYDETTTKIFEDEAKAQSTSGQDMSSDIPNVLNSLETKHEPHIETMNVERNIPNNETITEDEEATLYGQQTVTISDITSRKPIKSPTEGKTDKNILPSIHESRESSEDFTEIIANEDIVNEPKEVISNPPILELNSHVPFLQIGGHYSSDSYSAVNEESQNATEKKAELRNQLLENSEKDPVQVATETTLQQFRDTTNPDETNSDESSEKYEPITSYISEIDTTSHIPLTPGDLKVIAEYMINERIKPANQKNNSTYFENQWLKGNLTSEEKMASILSAANITIGIINRTNSETKSVWPETTTKTNEFLKIEKFEKEQLFKGNSILDDKNIVSKYSKSHDQSKSYSKMEKHDDSVTPPESISSIISEDVNNEQDSSTSGDYNRKDSTESIFMGKILVPQNNLTEATFLINSPRSPTEDVNKTTVTEEKEDLSRTQRVLSSSSEKTISDDVTSDSARSQDSQVYHNEAP